MSDKQREIIGILLIIIGVFVMLSLMSHNPAEEATLAPDVAIENWMGILGVMVSTALIKYTIGYVSAIFPLLLMLWGFWLFSNKSVRPLARFSFYISMVAIIASSAMGLPDAVRPGGTSYAYSYSGLVGGVIARLLHDFLGLWGAILILTGGMIITIRGYVSWSLYSPIEVFSEYLGKALDFFQSKRKQVAEMTPPSLFDEDQDEEFTHEPAMDEDEEHDESPRRKWVLRDVDKEDEPEEEPESESEQTYGPPSLENRRIERSGLDQDELSQHDEDASDESSQRSDSGSKSDDYSMDHEVIEEEVRLDELREQARRREYHLPSSDLLKAPVEVEEGATREELVSNANLLEQALTEFGVEARVVHISPGPIITRYELEPAKGVRINKFTALADDLARVMRAQRVRVLAPIPGKAAVGIEIPNKHPSTVYLKHIINSKAFTESEHLLTLALGKTTSGEAYVANLAKMPHVLIAGATGSGKSVCINTMIMSLLYQAKPEELKFILVDPKKLELAVYQQLAGYHLITSEDLDEYVITKPNNAVSALRSAEIEMERRYDVLSQAQVRDIDQYNRRVESGRYDGEHLPYIVVVIDELADLMITAAKEVEEPIARLAQMARAVGIHLIVATQRPSVDVLTGVIKANFPARIAFQVASKTDSRTILDYNGAEKLLGRGDMLYLPPAQPEPIRLHNSFVSLEEIEDVLDHISTQPKDEEVELPSIKEATDSVSFTVGDERDEYFHEALKLVVQHQQGSISLLQRRLRIGYSRAARIIDELEEAGIVGSHEGSKARDVLVDETFLEQLKSGEIQL